MPLMRGAAELLAALETARAKLRTEHRYIRQEARKLLDFSNDPIAVKTLGNNILVALAKIDQAEKDIDDLIREELHPKLQRKSWRETRADQDMNERIAALERRIEELTRPGPKVVSLKDRKEGSG
jgi:hypothetical protein